MLNGDTVLILVLETRCHHSDPDGGGVPTLIGMEGPFRTMSDAGAWLEKNDFRKGTRPTTHFGLDGAPHPLIHWYDPPSPDDWNEDEDGIYDYGGGCYAKYAQVIPADDNFSSVLSKADLPSD